MSSHSSSSLWFATALLPSGWEDDVRITLAGGCIRSVQSGVRPEATDDQHRIGIAGAVNVHSHAFQRALAGLTEHRHGSANFWSWRDAMYALVQKITPDQFEAIAAEAYVEMLEAGITRVGEFHYLHHAQNGEHYADIAEHAARLAAVAHDTGMGLTVLPVFYAHSGVGGQAPKASQRRFINTLDSFARLLDATRHALAGTEFAAIGIAAHSLRAVTPEELRELIALRQHEPFHIHIAEQMSEVEEWQSWCGSRPVEWLLDHAPVDERWCLVHATHLTGSELKRVAKSKATIGLCPITEANLGDGVFPAKEFLALDGRFGIGTDSNVLIDFAEELRVLEYGQRLIHRERNVLHSQTASTGRTLFERALRGGASVLGRSGLIAGDRGSIAEGRIADIVALTERHPSMLERRGDALLDSWIFAGAPAIDCVWSAGRKVVREGVHVERERVARRYAAALASLMA
jgi:formimidoylglutamate deiminase